MARTNLDLAVAMGKRMAERRKARGLTQEAAAYLSGITHQQYNKAENGKTCISSDSLLKVSRALQTSADYLLTGTNLSERHQEMLALLDTLSDDQLQLASKVVQSIVEWETEHKKGE